MDAKTIWKIVKFIMDILMEGKSLTVAKAMASAKYNLTTSEVEKIWRSR